ncbi:kelch-like protein 5 [Episyrphus balteatus]|uniref:kelch-like protein 5 n=1 Tax=Episyrphus balteatus TaxID=286459 RepID=UPI002486A44C|nr:kelch-like protein 5 [Episyrphus balteatus]
MNSSRLSSSIFSYIIMESSNSNSSSSDKETTTIFENNQHATSITAKLKIFYEEEKFFDVVLLAGQDSIKIRAHKMILSAFSEYFLEIFQNISTISKINEVNVKEIESSTFKLIINYMCSGSIELSLEKIETILRGAVFLKMKHLVDGCCDFMQKNLNNGNCLQWLRLAKELSLSELIQKSFNFIYSHFKEVTEGNEFLLLNEIELRDILFKNNSYKDLEEQVFLGLVAWIEYEKSERQHLLFDMLSLVRYQFLTPKFIMEKRKSVCINFENGELIYSWLQYHLMPASRSDEENKITFVTKTSTEINLNLDEFAVIHLNPDFEAEIRRYNQISKKWSLDKKSLPLPEPKKIYSPIVIDEKLFLVGGFYNKVMESVGCLDLKTLNWSELPPMRVARLDSQLANLNGHLCAFGGYEDRDRKKFINSMEIFNFSTRVWTDLQPLIKPNARQRIVGHNGILYIFDFHHASLQCYNVSTNQWTSKKLPIDDVKEDFRTTGVDNFLYCIIGGELDSYKEWICYEKLTIKRYDLTNDTWCEVDVLQKEGLIGQMVTIIGSKILFVYGNDYIREYDLVTKNINDIRTSAKYYYHAYIFSMKL